MMREMKINKWGWILVLVGVGMMIWWSRDNRENEPTVGLSRGELILSNAVVEEVETIVPGIEPETIEIIIRGRLGDACAMVQEPEVRKQEREIYIQVRGFKPADAVCELEEKTFEEVVSIGVEDWDEGKYRLIVNGLEREVVLE